jgi:hypothetical protein
MAQALPIAPVRQSALTLGNPEAVVQAWGQRIFDLIEAERKPSLLSQKGFYSALMNWAMQDEHFKTQLFRFIDVLPNLNSPREIAEHLHEYLGNHQVKLSAALRVALGLSARVPSLMSWGIRHQVTWPRGTRNPVDAPPAAQRADRIHGRCAGRNRRE